MSAAAPVRVRLVGDEPGTAVAAALAPLAGVALDAAPAFPPDDDCAAVLIVARPPAWGLDAARAVRTGAPAVPLLFLAADPAFPADEAYALGAADVLAGPFSPAALRAKVGFLAELFRAAAALAEAGHARVRADRRQRFLAELAAATQPLTDPEGVTAVAARLLAEHLGADRCAYAEVEDEAVYVITGDHTRGVPSIVGRWAVGAFGAEHLRMMRANEPYVVRDADADPRVTPADLPAFRATAIRAVVCVPLHKDRRFTAAMAVHQAVPRTWTPEEVELVTTVVGLCWEALERARVVRRLRAGEEELRLVTDTLPALIAYVDADRRYRFVNRQYEAWFGRPRAEMEGRHLWEVIGAAAYAALRPHVDRGLAGERVEYEAFAPYPTGGRHIRAAFAPRYDGDRVAGFFSLITDVTERVWAEDAQRFLADAGEVLASSLDADETLAAVARLVVPRLADWCSVTVVEPGGGLRQVAVAHADPAKVAWANELAARYPPDPNAPRGVPAVVRSGEPEVVAEVTDDMLVAGARDPEHLAVLRGVGLKSYLVAPLTARGRTLWAVTFVAAESGRRYGPADLGLAVDLGRRAGLAVDNARLFGESQEALRLLGLLVEASARLTGSLDPAAVRTAILDLSRRLVAADAHAIWRLDAATGDWAVADSAGLSEAYLRDQGRIPGAGAMPDRPIVAEDAVAAVPLESRRAAYRAEGIASVLAAPLRVHGAVTGTLVFYYRTRRRFDEVTVRVASALADLAGAALGTAELYEREAASRRRAEEADRRKDEFLATLAHELRNPLAPIRNAVAVLRMAPPADAAGRLLEMMERQLGLLVHLVDDLLDVARVTSGKIVLRPERLDLRGVVDAAVETSRPAIDAARHELAIRLPADPLPVDGDRTRLTQVLTNLLTNAAKYTPDGGRIEVTAGRADGAVVVRVADTGVGIPADMLPKVFEVFTQVGRSADRSQGGLGLGLALVRTLAGMHGGAAWAESPGPGRGSTFVVRLPLAP